MHGPLIFWVSQVLELALPELGQLGDRQDNKTTLKELENLGSQVFVSLKVPKGLLPLA